MTGFETIREISQDALIRMARWVRENPAFQRELEEARRGFLAVGGGDPTDPARAERFLEWFLLEREGSGGNGAPVRRWLAAGCGGFDEPGIVESLCRSFCGVFRVEALGGDRIECRDALQRGTVTILLPRTAHRAVVGDTLVGRLFPVGEGLWMATDSIELFRGDAIYKAYETETLARKAKGGPDTPLSMSGLEIEKLLGLSGHTEVKGVLELERELGEFLGDSPELPTVEELSAALREVESPGRVLGPFLEALAFHTKLDIGEGQRLGLELWNAHRSAAPERRPGAARESDRAPQPPPRTGRGDDPDLGPRLLAELEAGEARGEEKASLFARLERMAGLAPEAEDPLGAVPRRIEWRTEEAGNLLPLYEEWVWEGEREGTRGSEACRSWIAEARKAGAEAIEDLDRSRAAEAFRVLALSRGPGAMADIAGEVSRFARWLVDTQELRAPFPLDEVGEALRGDFLRIHALREALERGSFYEDSEALRASPPRSWRVRGRSENGEEWLLDAGGHRARLPGFLDLAVGDLCLGKILPDGSRISRDTRFLPAELAP